MKLQVGQKVKLKSTHEVGVIIWIWENKQGDDDTYVAFFGEKFPEKEPEKKPYVLHYYASSLVPVE